MRNKKNLLVLSTFFQTLAWKTLNQCHPRPTSGVDRAQATRLEMEAWAVTSHHPQPSNSPPLPPCHRGPCPQYPSPWCRHMALLKTRPAWEVIVMRLPPPLQHRIRMFARFVIVVVRQVIYSRVQGILGCLLHWSQKFYNCKFLFVGLITFGTVIEF